MEIEDIIKELKDVDRNGEAAHESEFHAIREAITRLERVKRLEDLIDKGEVHYLYGSYPSTANAKLTRFLKTGKEW